MMQSPLVWIKRMLVARFWRRFACMYVLVLMAPLLNIAPRVIGEWDMAGGVGTFTWVNFPLSVFSLAAPLLVVFLAFIALLEKCWRRTSRWRSAMIVLMLFAAWLFLAEGIHAEYVALYMGNTWLTIELWFAFLFGWGGVATVLALGWCAREFVVLQQHDKV